MREPSLSERKGFTLVELLISMVILTLLLMVLVSMTSATQRTWISTTGKIEQFRDAREAFDSITRKLSQATLNTYWDYHYPTGSTTPDGYVRQSELRFISGDTKTLTGATNTPTHAIFFQAPLGFVNDTSYSDMENLLNTWGYFIEFADDSLARPDFINKMAHPPGLHSRFRLMELMEPANSLTLYNAEVSAGGNSHYTATDWFTTPFKGSSPYTAATRPVRVLAENIVALVLLPKLTPEEDPTGILLCPKFSYDSTETNDHNDSAVNAGINWKNQLPPVIQVTMVAVDESSFNRFQSGSVQPAFAEGLFADPAKYAIDLQTLQDNLRSHKINYRVFTTNVSIKSAKWSREQAN
jgi:uncharacterized protein (TIGR02599 family)